MLENLVRKLVTLPSEISNSFLGRFERSGDLADSDRE
jgi:hypothetical protein